MIGYKRLSISLASARSARWHSARAGGAAGLNQCARQAGAPRCWARRPERARQTQSAGQPRSRRCRIACPCPTAGPPYSRGCLCAGGLLLSARAGGLLSERVLHASRRVDRRRRRSSRKLSSIFFLLAIRADAHHYHQTQLGYAFTCSI